MFISFSRFPLTSFNGNRHKQSTLLPNLNMENISKRPKDDAFRQQKMPMWQPVMTPFAVILIFIAVGIAFIPSGVNLITRSNNIYESTIEYDDGSTAFCTISSQNEGKKCNMHFDITENFKGPLYVYYELGNYYQNQRLYVSSLNSYQLLGQSISSSVLSTTCDPMTSVGNRTLNPCGLIANSFFTDIISLSTSQSSPANTFTLDESDIAWASDKDKFKQADGFKSLEVACSNQVCDTTVFGTNQCKFYQNPNNGTCYQYYYPNEDTIKYLYESYPDQISPIEGVTNEHFKVWMRTAALPTFRKLYGKIDGSFHKGDVLSFNITANYEVGSFDGTKTLVISTLSDLGGKNTNLGLAYIVVGAISLFFGVVFAIKQFFFPRPLGYSHFTSTTSKN